jgi:hypothetical protein
MLHVRVVSPVALTEQLTSRLGTAPGVGAAGLSAQRAIWRRRRP